MSLTRAFRQKTVLTALFLAVFGAGMLSQPARSKALPPDSCKGVAGTYLTTVNDIEGVFMSRGLITFAADGNFFVNDSRQAGVPGVFEPFSSGQGAWACTATASDGLKVEAVALTFTFPSTDSRASIARVDYNASVDPALNKVTGKIALKLASEGDLEVSNPVQKPGEVLEEFQFSGERVILP